MHYRYERAVLAGSRFGIWLARVFGVKPKIVKVDLKKEEAERLAKQRHLGIQDVLPNGDEES